MDTGANGIIGRDLHTLRPMGCEQGALNRTDGSARFSHQDTVVLASVQGPSQVQKRLEMASRATVEVIFKPVAGAPGAPEKEMESVLRQIVASAVLTHLYPRTLIRVVAQELNDDGSMLAVAINAVHVALLDAGVPMRHTFAAATVAVRQDGSLLLDPNLADEEVCKSVCTFVYRGDATGLENPVEGADAEVQLISSLYGVGGAMSEEHYWAALATGRAASTKVLAFLRRHTQHHYARAHA